MGSFLILIWLFPLAFTLPEMEEWNILRWYRRNYPELPAETKTRGLRVWLVFSSLISLVWTAIAVTPGLPVE